MARLKITQPCERCGKPFHPWPKRKEQERRLFCSVACREIPELERFWMLVDKTDGQGPNGSCWQWQGRSDEDGYGKFYPSKSGTTARSHRYSWEFHNGPIPEVLCVLHRCDNPPCVRPDHLFLGTITDNNDDRIVKGRSLVGSDHGMAKLDEEAVKRIRQRYASGTVSQTMLASEYEVDQTLISAIVNHRNWKHVD